MSVFVDIAPETGWQLNFDRVGYYVHASRVYLSGIVLSTVDGATTSLILTVPPAVRPSSPVSLTLPVTSESDFTRDTALAFAASYSATLNTDGTLVVDALPDQAVNTPDPTVYKWQGASGTFRGRYPQPMYLGLLLGGASWAIGGGSDTYSSGSLAAHIAAGFTDIDSTYSVHGERVHLGGTVSAGFDGAAVVLSSLPSDAIAGLTSGDTFGTEVSSGGQKLPLEIEGTSRAYVDEDATIKAARDPPPLTWSCPKFQTRVSDTVFGGTIPIGQNFISGSPTPGELSQSQSVDYGTYTCTSGLTSDTCRFPGGLDPFTFDLDTLLAQCDPAPDWFLVRVIYLLNLGSQAHDGSCHGAGLCGSLQAVGLTVDLSASAGLVYLAVDGSTVTAGPGGLECYASPASPLYTGLTSLPFSTAGWPSDHPEMLWKAGQLSGSITVTPGGIVNTAAPSAQLLLIPLYEDRQLGLRSGDVVTLDGAGWPGTGLALGQRVYLPSLAYFGIVFPQRGGTIVDHADGTTPITVFPTETATSGDSSGTFTTNALGQVPGWIDRQVADLYVDITIDPNPTVTILIPKL